MSDRFHAEAKIPQTHKDEQLQAAIFVPKNIRMPIQMKGHLLFIVRNNYLKKHGDKY